MTTNTTLTEDFATFLGTRMNDEIETAYSRGATDEQAAEAAIEWFAQAAAHFAGEGE